MWLTWQLFLSLAVLALAWMLEKEVGGTAHLRTTPLPRNATGGRQRVAAATGPAIDRNPAATPASAPSELQPLPPFPPLGDMVAALAPMAKLEGAALAEGAAKEALTEEGKESVEGVEGVEGEEGEEGEEEVEELLDDLPCRVIDGLYIGSVDVTAVRLKPRIC